MSIDWNAVLNGTIALFLPIVLKALLDLRLAQFFCQMIVMDPFDKLLS